MIRITLVCSAGMSTSLLMEKIKQAAKVKEIEISIDAISEASIASELDKNPDIILLGPQIKYLESSIKDLVKNKIPVSVIPFQKYGMMDGEGVLQDILEILQLQ